jgi:hypothetical protein
MVGRRYSGVADTNYMNVIRIGCKFERATTLAASYDLPQMCQELSPAY